VRKILTVLLAGGSLLLGAAAASPAVAAKKPPPPIQLLCSKSLMGASLVSGVCVLPGTVSGVASDYIQPLAVSNPDGGDTFLVVSALCRPA
jgi:hypothetical protein